MVIIVERVTSEKPNVQNGEIITHNSASTGAPILDCLTVCKSELGSNPASNSEAGRMQFEGGGRL